MITSRVTPPTKEEGAEVDEVEGVGGAADSNRLERNYASLHLMVMASIAPITWKWSNKEKETEK